MQEMEWMNSLWGLEPTATEFPKLTNGTQTPSSEASSFVIPHVNETQSTPIQHEPPSPDTSLCLAPKVQKTNPKEVVFAMRTLFGSHDNQL